VLDQYFHFLQTDPHNKGNGVKATMAFSVLHKLMYLSLNMIKSKGPAPLNLAQVKVDLHKDALVNLLRWSNPHN
jgi:hypothetical protein